MIRILLIIGLFTGLGFNTINAQFIDNKIDVNISYGMTLPLSPKTVNEKHFITPSLFSGYSHSYFYSVEGNYNYRPNYSLGISWNKIEFSNWSNSNSDLFVKASSSISTLGPQFKLHSRFKEVGVQNKIELFTILTPYIAFINSSFHKETLFSTVPIAESNPIIQSRYSSLGIRLNIGAKYAVTQYLDLNLEIGGSYTKLDSQFYDDNSIVQLNAGVGIGFKFTKNKRYYL